jgi:hypothetical protein
MPELRIFPIVEAQSLDSIAQPTFGPIDVSGGSTASASMLLKSSKTSAVVGEKFKVTVEIKTNTVTINEYRIVIDFDPARLQVVDQDTTTPGTQVKLLDTIFTVATPATDNIVSSTGRITLIAKVASGNAFQVNRDVAEIEFQAQTAGSTAIKIFQDVNGSRLIRQSGVGVAFTPNQVTVQITASSGTTTTTTTTGSTPPPPPVSQTTTGGTTVNQIPVTAIEDPIGAIFVIVSALILITTGFKLRSERAKSNESNN